MVLNAETAILLGNKFELLSYPVDGFADIGGRVVLQYHDVNFRSCGEPAGKKNPDQRRCVVKVRHGRSFPTFEIVLTGIRGDVEAAAHAF